MSNSTVAPQGGILEGGNPSHYSTSSPWNALIIQAGVIIIFCRLLHYPLSKIRQPRVIAEVIGGILLGPSVFGRIPGFTNAIFPAASIPGLTAIANVGLILFLFLVGLEADFRFLVSNWRVALSVGALGMIIPFGLGVAIATGLYTHFEDEPGLRKVSFGVFLLFVGVAMAITAFPVLCRILTELKLLRTNVGIIVLSAGVGNDMVGWILLALCVSLVNAGSGITTLWIILVAIGYMLFLFFVVRPAFIWLLRRTGSLQNGPSQGMVALTILMVLASAFFTGVIGIHPIFGGFAIGLICPHDGGFAVKLTEKIEDLVSTLFLPLYFALSGLSTNLGLLNDGLTWAYVIGILACAFFGKTIGGTLAARATGLVWRESLTIGTLMSCKGLVELIVLNIGLQAKILSTKTFTMFVVMALVTTFATTPLVSWLYPRWYQIKIEAWRRGEIDWDTGERIDPDERSGAEVFSKAEPTQYSRVLAYLRLDTLPGMLSLVSLFARPAAQKEMQHPSRVAEKATEAAAVADDEPYVRAQMKRSLKLHGVRLTALTDRDSSVMRVAELDEYTDRDPVLNTMSAFGQAKRLAVSGNMLLGPEDAFAQSITERATDISAEMMLLPWSASGAMSEALPETAASVRDRFANGTFSNFIADAAEAATCPVAIFVDSGFGTKRIPSRPALSRTVSAISERAGYLPSFPSIKQGHHIYFPFFGSEDDRIALRLVLQLAHDPSVTATIVHFEPAKLGSASKGVVEMSTVAAASNDEVTRQSFTGSSSDARAGAVTTVLGNSPSAEDYAAFLSTLRDTLPVELERRVLFRSETTPSPAARALELAAEEIENAPKNAGDLIVLGRNEVLGLGGGQDPFESEARRALGDLAGALVSREVEASLLVVKAAKM